MSNTLVDQARLGYNIAINLSPFNADMYKFQTKADPFDATKIINDTTKSKVLRNKIKIRICRKSDLQKNSENQVGIGLVDGFYIISEYTNKLYEGDTFTYLGKVYTVCPVDEIKIDNLIINYKANLIGK